MRNLVIAGSIVASLAAAAGASAQQDHTGLPDFTATNIGIRVGGVFALDGPLRDSAKLWFGAGVEYYLDRQIIPGSTTYFSADWVGKSGSGGHGNFFPICVNERFNFEKAYHNRQAYGFIGAGIVVMDVSTTQTTGALRFGMGYDFSQSVFAEAAMNVSGQADGFQDTSIGFYLGYRF